MATFGIELEKGKAIDFLHESNQRLQKDNLVDNPFNGKICNLGSDSQKDYYLIHMKPIYFRIYLVGIFLFLIAFAIKGFGIWLLPGIIIFSSGVFWHKYFFYLMFKVGLRKSGYKGIVRLYSNDDMIERVVKQLKSV